MSAEASFLPMIKQFMRDDPTTAYYIKYTQGVYDPSISEYTTVPTEIACPCLILDLTRNSNGLSSVYGKEIIAGDKDCYMLPPEKAAVGINPLTIDTTNDRVRIANITYKVCDMKVADPTGSNPLLYQFMLRR